MEGAVTTYSRGPIANIHYITCQLRPSASNAFCPVQRPFLVIPCPLLFVLPIPHQVARVVRAELTQRYALMEHEVSLLKGFATAFGEGEESEHKGTNGNGTENKAGFGVEAGVLRVY